MIHPPEKRMPMTLPLVAALAMSLLGGCGHKDSADNAGNTGGAATNTAPATNPYPAPPGPAGPAAATAGGTSSTAPTDKTAVLVKNNILKDKQVNATRLGVAHTGNTVTLTGNVKTEKAKGQAMADAEKVPGVTVVNNQLIVTP